MSEELPGMLAVAKGVAEQSWPHTMDAKVWADEFVKLNPGADHALMLSWFANAIMAGYDTALARATVAPSAELPRNYGLAVDDPALARIRELERELAVARSATGACAACAEINARRCTNPKPVGDSACDCCQHHWHAIDKHTATDSGTAPG